MHDFELVATIENTQRAVPVREWLEDALPAIADANPESCSNRLMLLCSIAGCRLIFSVY